MPNLQQVIILSFDYIIENFQVVTFHKTLEHTNLDLVFNI